MTMTEAKKPQDVLHQLIEKMDSHQAELVLSFIKTLFDLPD